MTNRTWFILQIELTLAEIEEDRDSDSDDEIEYSGMIQPPLIKQLRTILSEYPDDGQILKVCKTNNITQVDKHWMNWLIDGDYLLNVINFKSLKFPWRPSSIDS